MAILDKLKHIADGFQNGFDVFVVVPCQELFHGLHVVVFPYSLEQLVVFGRDIFVFQSTVEVFVRWQLADVEFIQRGHPLVWEEPFLFCTLVGFQVLTITKARGKIIVDVDRLQLFCLDAHEIVFPFHGILDIVTPPIE